MFFVHRKQPFQRNKLTGKRKFRPHGISFIEVMVVIVILALIGSYVGAQLFTQAEQARVDTTKIQIRGLEEALNLYKLNNFSYPTTDQGLQSLLSKPDIGRIPPNWQGPYLSGNNLPKDAWGNEFVYTSDGQDFTIVSYGQGGEEGGSDTEADISSKDL